MENRRASKFWWHARIHIRIPMSESENFCPIHFCFRYSHIENGACNFFFSPWFWIQPHRARYQIGDTLIIEAIWYSKGMKLPREKAQKKSKMNLHVVYSFFLRFSVDFIPFFLLVFVAGIDIDIVSVNSPSSSTVKCVQARMKEFYLGFFFILSSKKRRRKWKNKVV